jgi:leucyl/phenylalanyl-tRNA--protein transferase
MTNLIPPEELLSAYCQGVFPMAHDDGIYWYDPDPRAIFPLDTFHIPRSLRRTIKKGHFEIRFNHDFNATIRACADPSRDGGWIDDIIIASYNKLHEMGFAHSVETWQDGVMVGGLYGVSIRGLFAGESMFSHATDASKVALVYLVQYMKQQEMPLLDTQFMTDHLRRFGAIEISRDAYKKRLDEALKKDVRF